MNDSAGARVGKLPSGISGIDRILPGGIPELSTIIIAGLPGSGKTILTQQILYANASPTRKALYLTTLAEPAVKMLHFLQKLTFFDAQKFNSSIVYVNVGDTMLEKGPEETVRVILQHVEAHQPAIVAVDSFKALLDMTTDQVEMRKLGYQLSIRLVAWGVTAFFLGEYSQQELEQQPVLAIADGLIYLHYQSEGLHYQRYLDVLKMRGEDYRSGLHPFTITAAGLNVYPRSQPSREMPAYATSSERITTGLTELDAMCDGGLPVGTSTLIVGGSGTGKTLLGLHFIHAGISSGEPSVIVTLQENRVQLRQIGQVFGWDFQAYEEQGLLLHLYHSPIEIQPDIHADMIKTAVQQIRARRVLIDPITDIEISTPDKMRFRNYVTSLINNFKVQGITTLLVSEIPDLFGPLQLREYGISFATDNVILLRYVELFGRMGRAIHVMKVRGSQHSKDIRTFTITSDGMCIGNPVQAVTGVLTGALIVRDENGLRDLPDAARSIIETLARQGNMTLEQLQRETGLTRVELERELSLLQQQGLVIPLRKDGAVSYRNAL